MKTVKPRQAAMLVIPMMPDGRIIFLKRSRPHVSEFLWELPSGPYPSDGDTLMAATELLHRTTDFVPDRLVPLGSFYPAPAESDETVYCFLARGLEPSLLERVGSDHVTSSPISITEASYLVAKGHIRCGRVLAALMMLEVR